MKIGFTGTRDGMTDDQRRVLVEILCSQIELVRLHHGCCVGADEQAHWLAFEAGIGSIGYPPVDHKLIMGGYDEGDSLMFDAVRPEKPYLDRNRDIVDETDMLIACPKGGSVATSKGGTFYTIRYALKQGKPVTIIWPDGSTTEILHG